MELSDSNLLFEIKSTFHPIFFTLIGATILLRNAFVLLQAKFSFVEFRFFYFGKTLKLELMKLQGQYAKLILQFLVI
jgi:hypothetical protein